MEYLIENGISKEVVDNLKETCDEHSLLLLESNDEKIIEVINYLRNFGLNNDKIEELLFLNLDFFLNDIKTIDNAFSKYNKYELLSVLNTDIATIDRFL